MKEDRGSRNPGREGSGMGKDDEFAVSERRLRFSRCNGPIDDAIDHLLDLAGVIHHSEIVREMLLAALKTGQENPEKADLKLILSTLKEMRFTCKVFRPYRHVRKISVFGSARVRPETVTYQMARELGRELAGLGLMVITGGGEGIMQAVNEGAGPDHSFGVSIRLPYETQSNYVVEGSPRSITYKYFFNRKVAFIKETDGVVVFPGGFGTMDEAMEILTLLQTGKRTPIPLVLVDEPDGTYWSRWIDFLREELASRFLIRDKDLTLFDLVTKVKDGVDIIGRFFRRYHSMRQVGERLVIRMSLPLSPHHIEDLQKDYEDLLVDGGKIEPARPLPEELENDDFLGLPRIVLDFNRRDFSRLKQMIDTLNAI